MTMQNSTTNSPQTDITEGFDATSSEPNKQLLAKDALRSYSKFLDKQAPDLVDTLIRYLRQFHNPESKRLQRSLQTILKRHPFHEVEILKLIAEYETPKLNRVDTVEKIDSGYIVVNREDPGFEEWRAKRRLSLASEVVSELVDDSPNNSSSNTNTDNPTPLNHEPTVEEQLL